MRIYFLLWIIIEDCAFWFFGGFFCTNGSSWSHRGVFIVDLNSLLLRKGYYTLLFFNHSLRAHCVSFLSQF